MFFLKLFASLLLFSFSAWAQATWQKKEETNTQIVWSHQSASTLPAYLQIAVEDSNWKLQVFKISKDGFQDLVESQFFNSKAEALVAAEHKMQSFKPELRETNQKYAISSAGSRSGGLWQVENQWNWEWEKKYAAWIKSDVTKAFFAKYQLSTDCADVPIYLRWIFARNNKLPVLTHLMVSGQPIHQDSMRKEWLRYPTAANWFDDKRFLQAVTYVTLNTDTRSLVKDSYSIEIKPESFIEGTYHVILHKKSGHAQFVHQVFSEQETEEFIPYKVISSTVPRKVRDLVESHFWDAEQPTQGGGGFLRARWAVEGTRGWELLPAEKMPFSSLEQYSEDFMTHQSFALSVLFKLRSNLNIQKVLEHAIETLLQRVGDRARLVREALYFCAHNSCEPGSKNFNDWSTPSRDNRIADVFSQIEEIIQMQSFFKVDLLSRWNEEKLKPQIQVGNEQYTLEQVQFAWENSLYSTDPREPLAKRWGLDGRTAGQVLGKRAYKTVMARINKIKSQGSACTNSGTCSEGSDLYSKWNTFLEDIQLRKEIELVFKYCGVSTQENCDRLSSLWKTESVNVGNSINMTMVEIVEASPFLNGDPRVSLPERWGSISKKFHVARSNFSYVNVRPNGWSTAYREFSSVNEADYHYFPYNISTGEELSDESQSWGYLDKLGKYAASIKNGEIRLMNLATQKKGVAGKVTALETSVLYFSDPFLVVVADNKETHIFVRNQESWTQQISLPGLISDSVGDEVFIVENQNNYKLIDLMDSQVRTFNLPLLPEGQKYSMYTSGSKVALLKVMAEDLDSNVLNSTQSWIWNRKTQNLSVLDSSLGNPRWIDEEQGLLVTTSPQKELALQTLYKIDFNQRVSQKLLESSSIEKMNSFVVSFDSVGKQEIYEITGGNIKNVKLPANSQLSSVSDQYYVLSRTDLSNSPGCLYKKETHTKLNCFSTEPVLVETENTVFVAISLSLDSINTSIYYSEIDGFQKPLLTSDIHFAAYSGKKSKDSIPGFGFRHGQYSYWLKPKK